MPSVPIYFDDPLYKRLLEEIEERMNKGEDIGRSTPVQEALMERYKMQKEEKKKS